MSRSLAESIAASIVAEYGLFSTYVECLDTVEIVDTYAVSREVARAVLREIASMLCWRD
jgi:hypothetical protein